MSSIYIYNILYTYVLYIPRFPIYSYIYNPVVKRVRLSAMSVSPPEAPLCVSGRNALSQATHRL